MRNVKIVCTVGPISESHERLRDLFAVGMDVARFNASHGTVKERRTLIERVEEVERITGTPVPRLLDLAGPEIRTASTGEPVFFEEGDEVRFVDGEDVSQATVGLTHSVTATDPGDRILLNDGRIETSVNRIDGDAVVATVDVGGELTSRSGVNVPGVDLGLDPVTDADRDNAELAAELGVEFVAASFVRNAADVLAVRKELETLGAEIPVIAKIERAKAIDNLDEIVDAAGGVMVARGDLGVECPLERVPIIQKRVIRKCNRAGIPVITATEMLDSMIERSRPTRAEASDVANAVFDGTDAVMLSGETAVGAYPVRSVKTMDRIIRDAEDSEEFDTKREQDVPPAMETRADALARSARYLARDLKARAIVVASESGYTARKVAKYRPAVPVVAVTPERTVQRQLALTWGIVPRFATLPTTGADDIIQVSVDEALAANIVESGDTVVVLSGMMTDSAADTANTLKVHVAAETLASGRGATAGRAIGRVFRTEDGNLEGVPEDTVVVVGPEFDGTFEGSLSRLAAIISAQPGVTGYAAQVARELGIPMVSNIALPSDVAGGDVVTVDGERGVVYFGAVPEP